MSEHQHDDNASKLWAYFQAVIAWTKRTFPVYRKELMKGFEWGLLYNKYKDAEPDTDAFEETIKEVIKNEYEDITKPRVFFTIFLIMIEVTYQLENLTTTKNEKYWNGKTVNVKFAAKI